MHNIQVSPAVLQGTVSVPPSKSAAHRAIICAALAKGDSVLAPVEMSNDIQATIHCMRQLGAKITLEGKTLTVNGEGVFSHQSGQCLLDCGESGSTLRFLIPVAAAGNMTARFVGHGKLPERPIGVYADCLPAHQVSCQTEGGLPLTISGALQSGVYEIPGNISSQFITGLMLALPLCSGDSRIVLTSPAESVGYIHMTMDIMRDFGVIVSETENGWFIKGGQHYQPRTYTIEGDWSQAAFFMTAASIAGEITIDNLSMDSRQGDKACVELYRRMGAAVTVDEKGVTIRAAKLHGIEVDAADIPDMVPALSAAAALAEGRTVICHARRLRIKECDRLAAMCDGLNRLGAHVTETEDGLIIDGVERLTGGMVEGYNDHRIVMSMAAVSVGSTEDVIITDMESINKSYPGFFEDFKKLGGKTNVLMG